MEYNLKKIGQVPNVSMMFNGSLDPKSTRATEVGSIMLSHILPIDMDKRMRPLDRNNLDRLKADIATRGLLQPIGVRATKGDRGMPYELIYGFHRYVAFCELFEEDKTDSRIASGDIPAVIYPSSMTPNQCIEAELVENLLRKELTAVERGQHEVRYAAVLKRMGAVATANERKAEGGKTAGNGRPKSSSSHDAATATPQKPTVTQKLMEVAPQSPHAKPGAKKSPNAVKDRFNKTKKAAGVHSDVTLETATPEQLDEIAAAAEMNNAKVKAETQERKSKAAEDRARRSQTPPDEKLAEHIRGHVAVYGWDVMKKAIQIVWREDHAPEGRVVFNTTFGPGAEDSTKP